MLDIGIVGLGAISQKAYLPYMRQLRGINWHLSTRNESVRQEVGQLFGCTRLYRTVNELLEAKLDGVFIHAATKAHLELASLFLQKGIPVYMDKPLTEDFFSTRALYQLAKEHNTFLMAGFNRRFAPGVKRLSTLSTKRKVVVEKNDINRPGDKQFKLFDFFIHPLDTALFLADERLVAGYFHYQLTDNDLLSQVSVTLRTEQTIISVAMNLQSGSRREVMEVQTPKETYQLENLESLRAYRGVDQEIKGFSAWDTTLSKRGFEAIVDSFLQAVKDGVNPVQPGTSLLSHWICHQICQSHEADGILDVCLPYIKE
ncbi:TPA: Gfo/Idh/MocA family oxidoreductase [Streptococcus equi subsp. zooepidemicus]|uniref:Gfo/Idh/MocA family protein n=1 Tax=Streptococcus equi TaxID=1336 RepID=UPI0005BD4AE8|nr:Gfo/Idh/MocA family oxidoreductase [Streptococcus equi]KIS09744.1 oxidoreductase [Streptococcus equi subsp. zooepidemicus Sz57]MCD3436724.1 Gfo/Idh/MocA family oxidoreductase [Streptococcus equi subsp. zooepidemicus]HEL0065482.1 Gfo/Idh/MocA family oxidoreductase [Streptococcus equi subsp. zooepidemicus]HEL0073898.1 Gfo/Idh/MocA family oxidoreductase [Streptococcus equi subsp. zooepidemicus]HEL0087768.1 Gfo/Idh/MocA family oxidoreductase [Streptococcus equi subsp. zooepidemicus]